MQSKIVFKKHLQTVKKEHTQAAGSHLPSQHFHVGISVLRTFIPLSVSGYCVLPVAQTRNLAGILPSSLSLYPASKSSGSPGSSTHDTCKL